MGKAPSASAGARTQKPEADKKAEEEKRKAEEAKKAATASAGWTAANGKDSYTLPGKNGSLESKDGARVVKVSGVKRLGVDVSSHNGTIDWKRAKAAGVEFAIIRCGSFNKTTGLHGVDKQFVRNVQGAREAGIPVGVYLYSYAKTVKGETWSAQAEARNVLSFLEKAGVTPADMALPVYYDLEDAGQALLPAQTLGEMATEFCNTLSEAGYRTGIYANKQWWGSRLTDAAFDNPTWHVWAARYPSKGALTGSGVDGAQIWQFSERGKVDGIPGSVDMNFDFGVSEQEMRLAASTVDPNRQVAYAAYVQGTGWQSWAADGLTAGTSGQKLRMEAFSLRLSHETLEEAAQAAVEKAKAALPEGVAVSNTVIVSGDASASDGEEGSNAVDAPVAPDVAQVAESMPLASAFAKQHDVVPGLPAIEYRACVEGHGWQEWRSNGQTAGTTGQSKRIEALEIRLSGSVADVYDVRYRAQVEKDGWTEWAENGQTVGSEGLDRRIEAFEVQLTPKTA